MNKKRNADIYQELNAVPLLHYLESYEQIQNSRIDETLQPNKKKRSLGRPNKRWNDASRPNTCLKEEEKQI